jgi:hypothetical protein
MTDPTLSPDVQDIRAASERKAQQLFGPELWGSDRTWDWMGLNICLSVLLCPLKERVQALYRRLHEKPVTFQRELQKIFLEHARKVAKDRKLREYIPWYIDFSRRLRGASEAALPHSTERTPSKDTAGGFRLPEHYGRVQIEAFDRILLILGEQITGFPAPKRSRKEWIKDVSLVTAPRRGRPSREVLDQATKIFMSGKYHNRPYHHICLELNSDFAGWPTSEQAKYSKSVEAGIRRRMNKQSGTKPPR